MDQNSGLNGFSAKAIGAAIEVHRILGPGLLESVYEEAMAVELAIRGVDFARQVPLSVDYKQHGVGQARLDLVIASSVILELKAVESILPIHYAQLLSYLQISRFHLGLLINFNVIELRQGIRRVILDPKSSL